MNTTELINAVLAHLNNIVTQRYTVCAENIARTIIDAGGALGIIVLSGAYDPDTATMVLYVEH